MSIETVYRGALRVYPPSWRARHEDAALGVLLDAADAEGRDGADWRQVASLLTGGALARLDRVVPRRWRDLAATSVVIGTTGFALLDFLFFEWQPWTASLDLHPQRYWFYGPFASVAVWALIPWLVGFVFQLAGLARWARAGFAASGLAAAVLAWLGMHEQAGVFWHFHDTSTPDTLAVFVIGSIVAVSGRPSRAAGPWLLLAGALASGGTIAALWVARGGAFSADRRLLDDALWTGWLNNSYGGDALLDSWLLCFFVVAAALAGLRLYRFAAPLAATLGPLGLVAAFWWMWRRGFLVWGPGWWPRDGVYEASALALIACAFLAARLLHPAAGPLLERLQASAAGRPTPLL